MAPPGGANGPPCCGGLIPWMGGGGKLPGGGMRKSGGSAPGGGNGIPFGSVGSGGPGGPEGLGGNGGNGIPRPRGATARTKSRSGAGLTCEKSNNSRGMKPAGGPFPGPPGMGKGSGGTPPTSQAELARRMTWEHHLSEDSSKIDYSSYESDPASMN